MRETEVEGSLWLHKVVRVVGEDAGRDLLGRMGLVLRVFMRGGEEWARLAEETRGRGTTQFEVRTGLLADAEYESKVSPMPPFLNRARLRGQMRDDVVRFLQAETHPDNLEAVVAGRPIGHMSIKAALYELEARFQDPNVIVVGPDVAAILGQPVQHGSLPEGEGGEVASLIKSIRAARCTYFAIWAEGTMHYTYLKVQQMVAAGNPAYDCQFTYKDSISPPSAANAEAASNLLRNCGFLAGDALAPQPSNRDLQQDGWSSGLHVVKWIELDLRGRRGEPRLPDPTVDEMLWRTNAFISMTKETPRRSSGRRQEMTPHTAPTDEDGVAEAFSVMEPQWGNLENALGAAQGCQRCVATKGCRACRGNFFEEGCLKASGRKRLRTGASPDETRQTRNKCLICVRAEANVAYIGCGHLCFCFECSESGPPSLASCPHCRKPSHRVRIWPTGF